MIRLAGSRNAKLTVSEIKRKRRRSAVGFNVRKLLNLLGKGIFSRALLVWGGFCRRFGSMAMSFWKTVVPTMPKQLCTAKLNGFF